MNHTYPSAGNNVNENIENSANEKRLKRASMISSTVLSAILSVAGCFMPIASILLFALSAGYMAAGFCANKKLYPLIGIIPAIIAALITKSGFLSILILLTIPLCALIMYFCVSKKAKKTLTIIACSVVLGLMVAIVLSLAVSNTYGSVSVEALQQLSDDIQADWNSAMEKVLELMREQYELSYEQYTSMGVEISKDSIEQLLDEYSVLLLNDIPTMVKNLLPAIAIAFLNMLSYIAASILYHLLSREKGIYKITANTEQAKLSIEMMGMIIFMASYIISIFTGSYQTVIGSVFTNLFLIYLPAMTVIGIRMLFREGGIKKNLFYVVMIAICLFFNPLLAIPLIGFFAAANTINNRLIKYLEDINKDNNQ